MKTVIVFVSQHLICEEITDKKFKRERFIFLLRVSMIWVQVDLAPSHWASSVIAQPWLWSVMEEAAQVRMNTKQKRLN